MIVFHRQRLFNITSFRKNTHFCWTKLVKHKSTLLAGADEEFPVYTNTYIEEQYDSARPFSSIPGPRGLPFIGTLLHYTGPFRRYDVSKYHTALKSRWKEYGNVMKETIGQRTAVRVYDPDLVQRVYQNEGVWPNIIPILESSKKYRESTNMAPGLGNINGQEWNALRKAVQVVMMRPQNVADYLPFVNEVADDVLNAVSRQMDSSGNVSNFNNLAARWNMETAGMICFEKRLGSLEEGLDSHPQRMIKANYDIFDKSTKLMYICPWSVLQYKRLCQEHYAAEDYFYSNGQHLIDKTVASIKAQINQGDLNDERFKFLSYLLSKTSLSYKDISITALTVFADGLNATVPALLAALFCLAKNPESQQKAYEEINLHCAEDDYITIGRLNKLSFLKACVKESFRFYPLNLDIKRVLNKDIAVGGYQIPAGTTIELCPFVHLLSSTYFDEPMKFLPERWLRGSKSYKMHHPFVVIPFSHGPRMCIGRRIAEQDIYVMLTKLLKKFKITTPTEELDLKYQILQTVENPITFTFEYRQ